ncbi:MAG: hypothetical protein ABIA91_02530 [Patescibacteria group bacterium]
MQIKGHHHRWPKKNEHVFIIHIAHSTVTAAVNKITIKNKK